MVERLKAGDTEGVKPLVAELAGYLQEVRKRRHLHRDPQKGCWCEFAKDAWKVSDSYDQITLESVGADAEPPKWGAGVDARMDSIAAMYGVEDAGEAE